jgi:RNA polymerase sigma-70 factor (ECF subfamily)
LPLYIKKPLLTRQEFKLCFDQYFQAIWNYIYYKSGDAELSTDLAQDTFMKVWEKQIPFEGNRTKSLLYKIVNDNFVSHIRKDQVKDKYLNTIHLNYKSDCPEAILDYKELKHYYEKALTQLPEKQRVVFLMSRVDGFTYAEIAARLDISVKAVEKRMSKTLTSLRKKIQVS